MHMFCSFSGLAGAVGFCRMTDWSLLLPDGGFLPECTAVTAIELLSFTCWAGHINHHTKLPP